MMLDLNGVYYFVQIVERQGFSAASKELKIPKSSLSRRVQELEAHLGARLIHRTSRRFAVTDAGLEFYRHGRAMLGEAEAAEQSVKRRVVEPQGPVRITCPVAVSQYVIADIFPQFYAQFPKVEIVEHATNRYVDLIEEGFDFALRAHSQPLPDSSLIQRSVAKTPWALFAGRSYVERYGVPSSPGELSHHTGLLLKNMTSDNCWRLRQDRSEVITIPFKPKLDTDDIRTLKIAAEAGIGIVALPTYLCETEIDQAKLVPILPQWTAGYATMTLLAPSPRGFLPSVRALWNFLALELEAYFECKRAAQKEAARTSSARIFGGAAVLDVPQLETLP
jgi:DNA-binding transcriptional LysR family regulator